MRIALLNDLHDGEAGTHPQRRCELAPILLERAVARLNRLIRPDLTLVLGDLLDAGSRPDAPDRLARLRRILDGLAMPAIVIPGNHDGDIETFYRVFDRPQDIEELDGVRFLPFLDQEEPGYNARRSPRDIDRLKRARHGFDGPIVALQHTCLFPPDRAHAPHNLLHANTVIAALQAAGVSLSVSGHYHKGLPDIRTGNLVCVNAPAMCEFPFPFVVLELDRQGHVETQQHTLAMPKALRLVDGHMHTQLAYCSQNMDVARAIGLATDFGLAGIVITEHSGQLYFNREDYWSKLCLREGMAAAGPDANRMSQYMHLAQTYARETVRFGLEADCDYQGNLLMTPDDRSRFDPVVGAIHGLPFVPADPAQTARVQDDFLRLVESTLKHGVSVLAHPFRIFGRSKVPIPDTLFRPVAQLLRRYGVAAEINYHTHEPPVEFIHECLEHGVKFAFGSDAHNLYEIGDFTYHLAVLKQAGFDGDLDEVLIR